MDLNRDFPDLDRIVYSRATKQNNHIMDVVRHLDHKVQPETESVMKLIMEHPFVISANIHGGDLVANFPYDEGKDASNNPTEYSASPDDETFRSAILNMKKHFYTFSPLLHVYARERTKAWKPPMTLSVDQNFRINGKKKRKNFEYQM